MGTSLRSTLAFTARNGSSARDRARRLGQVLSAPWRAWQERRRAAACSREVLRLHSLLARAKPWLTADQRYRDVVSAYLLCDATDANALVRCAEASFASWPARRELCLRDVAHYLAVSELLAATGQAAVEPPIKSVIDAVIPPGL